MHFTVERSIRFGGIFLLRENKMLALLTCSSHPRYATDRMIRNLGCKKNNLESKAGHIEQLTIFFQIHHIYVMYAVHKVLCFLPSLAAGAAGN